ncbi:metal-dependent hydrolase [Penicillium chermesinum]|nr:metal-dependent hydrolase [Penicillium chermesinum]
MFITLEEHYMSPAVRAAEAGSEMFDFPQDLVRKLDTLGAERIQDMDNGRVSVQVISHGPGDRSPELCVAANNGLATAIAKYPSRLAGFAMIPMRDPTAAAHELERCVRSLGFVGALIDNHQNGQFYDNEMFWPVFGKAEELDVPLYIHPAWASETQLEHYRGNFDDSIAVTLSAFGWGWHSDTALCFLKLYASGLFDRFPRLKIVIGHMGEMLPFQLDRVIKMSRRWGRKRGLQDIWRENVWVTTSGMFSLPPLACLLQTTSIDHVLYSVDYPFSSNETGLEFVGKIKESGLLSEEDLEKFAFRNAERLLRITA